MTTLPALIAPSPHALIAAAGARASYRFFEFFTAQIRNTNTRRAYARAAVEFIDWLARDADYGDRERRPPASPRKAAIVPFGRRASQLI